VTLAEKIIAEQSKWKRFCDDHIKQSRHYLGKKQLRHFALGLSVPLTRLEVLMLYQAIENQAMKKGEQKKLAEVVKDPVKALKVGIEEDKKSLDETKKTSL
jgi:hypothetical protein